MTFSSSATNVFKMARPQCSRASTFPTSSDYPLTFGSPCSGIKTFQIFSFSSCTASAGQERTEWILMGNKLQMQAGHGRCENGVWGCTVPSLLLGFICLALLNLVNLLNLALGFQHLLLECQHSWDLPYKSGCWKGLEGL